MRGHPEQEAKAWLEKLSEIDQERRGYLCLAAKGRITDEELDEALTELEETREAAERELEALRSRRKTLGELEGRPATALCPDGSHSTGRSHRRRAPSGLQDAPTPGSGLPGLHL